MMHDQMTILVLEQVVSLYGYALSVMPGMTCVKAGESEPSLVAIFPTSKQLLHF